MKPIIRMLIQSGCTKQSKILDVGCGSGDTVQALIELGYDAYGVDLQFKSGEYVESLSRDNRLVLMSAADMNLPFRDGTFDFIICDQVIEHVADLDKFSAEAARVLNEKGVLIGYYPSRLKPVEPHVGVPFAGFIQNPYWINLWVSLGVYRRKNRDPRLAVRDYLTRKTHYRSLRAVRVTFSKHFSKVRFDGALLLNAKGKGWISKVPGASSLINAGWSSVIVSEK